MKRERGHTHFQKLSADEWIGIRSLFGDEWFVDTTNGDDDLAGNSKALAFATIQEAVDNAAEFDTIHIAPGAYDETVTISTNNLTIIGEGGRGGAYIEPSTSGAEGMQVAADDITIINLGIAGDSAADYALNLNSAARFRAYECKIEGVDGTVLLIDGTDTDQTADALFQDCEFAWGYSAVVFDDSSYGYPTQIRFRNCWFHNMTTACMALATGGGVANLEVTDCVFDAQEDGTEPTDYIVINRAGDSGIFSGNRFATATNATGVLTIAADIQWVANATEAGWSSARPS